MIKINLLNSVTERQGGAAVAVDRKIASPASRFVVMSLVVAALLAAVIGWDIISTQMAKTEAERQLAEQKQIEADLAVVIAEQKDLEQKIQNIDMRIEAIKKLRGSQAGPSAVLEAMRERIAMTPGLYLESVEQNGEQLTFKGNSPDESQVTQFGRSLEFSNGLFSNLSIETTRAEIQNQNAPQKVNAEGEAPKIGIVNFVIKTAYTPSKAAGSSANAPTTASVPGAAQTQPVQVAKN
ncbi:MAG: PilN domain-containing protein [Pyrinomonadaceae bacterium]|nr:PilN domain-containing protein [Acidobacteriota bacterium]MBK7933650.1 PilN domain-containing protein [Acidobacteriota bacterium]MBP7376730.1 PilN domain-containing protein [Pyrinomonadaceae bacterium]